MNIKSVLFATAAGLVAVSGAHAADAVVIAEPEPVEYVRVCDAYGAGFFYIPGTETCLKISGYVRYDAKAGDDAYKGGVRNTWAVKSRAALRFDARSDTELGTLRSYIETHFNYNDGANSGASVPHGYIELGGFRVGATDSQFSSYLGYLGDIISDDVIESGAYQTNQISYTFAGYNGFSATLGFEQGDTNGINDYYHSVEDYLIDDYTPHIVGGAKFSQGWGTIGVVAGYDSVFDEWAAKVRVDLKFNDTLSAWVQAGYKSNGDEFRKNYFGRWNGNYAIWGGLAVKASERVTANAQVAYEDDGTFATALNVKYMIVPGFIITPEINYTSFGGDRRLLSSNTDAFQSVIRFQRNF